MTKTLMSAAMLCFVLPLIASAAPPAPTQTPAQAPSKAVQAPAQAPVQAPAKTAQATNGGYRTYSYMPGSAPANDNYYYNSRNNYYNNPNNGRPAFFSGHQPADYKVRGEFWAR